MLPHYYKSNAYALHTNSFVVFFFICGDIRDIRCFFFVQKRRTYERTYEHTQLKGCTATTPYCVVVTTFPAVWVFRIGILKAYKCFIYNPLINAIAQLFYCVNQSTSIAHSHEFLDKATLTLHQCYLHCQPVRTSQPILPADLTPFGANRLCSITFWVQKVMGLIPESHKFWTFTNL